MTETIEQSSLRQKARRHPLFKLALHPAITIGCFLILFVLVFFGTLYQTEHGLYESQQKFFQYGFVLIGGFFPLPGATSVLWVLSVQLLLLMLLILPFKWNRIGLWISHVGIFILFFGGYITQLLAVESQMTLAEGETGHLTTAYHEWELAFWEQQGDTNTVTAIDSKAFHKGNSIPLNTYNAWIEVQNYLTNSEAFTKQASTKAYVNASGIGFLEGRKPEKEVTRNFPGLTFTLRENGKPDQEVLMYGAEIQPLILKLNGKTVFCKLRLKHYPLDFSLKLTRFVKNVHPGTDIPSSFESYADLQEGPSSRNVKVWMNNPLRYQGFTFFQASYSQMQGEVPRSTFAVVTNPGRVLPYVSSITVFVGLLIHFLLKLTRFIRKGQADKSRGEK